MLRPRLLAWSGVRGDVPDARSGGTHGAQDVPYDVKSGVTVRNHRSRRCRKLQRSVNTPSHEQTRRAGCVIVFMDSHRQSLAGPRVRSKLARLGYGTTMPFGAGPISYTGSAPSR